MPRFYCEYCDVYLKCASQGCRREHNFGRRHITNKIDHYQHLIRARSLAPPIHQPPMWLVGRIRKKMMPSVLAAAATVANTPVQPIQQQAPATTVAGLPAPQLEAQNAQAPVNSDQPKPIIRVNPHAVLNANAGLNNMIMPQVMGSMPYGRMPGLPGMPGMPAMSSAATAAMPKAANMVIPGLMPGMPVMPGQPSVRPAPY